MNDQTGPGAPRPTPTSMSLIDRESHFTGSYRTPHDLRIDGHYEGDIECRGTVYVGETATVSARVMAGAIIVAGQFSGEIACEARFELLPTGRVSAAVSAATTVVHDGAFYEGERRMFRPGQAPARTAARPAAAPTTSPPRAAGIAAGAAATPAAAQAAGTPAPGATGQTTGAGQARRRADDAASRQDPEMPASLIATANGPRGAAGNGRSSESAGR